jgi:class 3 adenylate cyclase
VKTARPAFLAIPSFAAVLLVAYWATGPQELAPWRGFGNMYGNMGVAAQKAAWAKATPAQKKAMYRGLAQPEWTYMDKLSLPVIAQSFFLVGTNDKEFDAAPKLERPWEETARTVPATGAERAFTRFMALDSLAASVLALALLIWRRHNVPASQLATALGLFALATALFLANGQARLRGGLMAWPSGSRLLSDVTATLAFGMSILCFDRFFSTFPVPIEDWEVVRSQLRWKGRPLSAGNAKRPWYKGGSGNLVSLARRMMMLILGILLAGSLFSTLPAFLHSPGFSLVTAPDGSLKGYDRETYELCLKVGALSGLVALVLIVAFGWLMASSLVAKLHTGREQCTEEERRQADWLYAGGLVTALMLAVFSLGLLLLLFYAAWGNGDWLRLYGSIAAMMFFPAGWAVMLFALAGAVFLSRSFGPKPLLKRTLLITGIGLTMSFVLAIIEHTVTSRILGHSTEALQQGVSAILAGGIVVFPVGLFRNRIEKGIDGLLDRYMPATAIAEGKRRDMAVMFSDLGGFSALSATNEQDALVLAGLFQKEAAESARRHGGRIVKTIGDAVLWVFATPAAAFAASMDLSACFAREARRDKLPELPVNSGVHFGSLVEAHDGDVYGAAVNLAGHIKGVAKDGSVVASMEAVVGAAEGFQFESMGKLELKNIPTPIPCFRVTAP